MESPQEKMVYERIPEDAWREIMPLADLKDEPRQLAELMFHHRKNELGVPFHVIRRSLSGSILSAASLLNRTLRENGLPYRFRIIVSTTHDSEIKIQSKRFSMVLVE